MACREKRDCEFMIAGHFGFAALVKGREQSTPLWVLMLASVWLDIEFVPLFLAGIKTIQPVGGHQGYGSSMIYADYTHSFAGMLVLSAILALLSRPFWGTRSAMVIGLVAASHWVLDLVVHRADMPILPGNRAHLPRVGFGLWRFPWVSAAIEAVLVLLGAGVYWAAARSVSIQAKQKPRLAAQVALFIATWGIFILYLDVST
jgi:hypothetical protein